MKDLIKRLLAKVFHKETVEPIKPISSVFDQEEEEVEIDVRMESTLDAFKGGKK